MATCRQSQKNENLNDLHQYRVTLRCAVKLLRRVLSLFGYNFKFMQHRRPPLGVGLPNPCRVTGNATDSFTQSCAALEDAFSKAGIPQSTLNPLLCQQSFALQALLWNVRVDSC